MLEVTIFPKSFEYLTQKITRKNIDKLISNFITVLSKDPSINLYNFFENLNNLKILIGSSIDLNAAYSGLQNQMIFKDNGNLKLSLYHECLHCASMVRKGNVIHTGFQKYDPKTAIAYAIGINEGYTSLLQKRYFKEDSSYRLERFYMQKLEEIIGKNTIKRLYFNADLDGLIEEMSKYASLTEIHKFIECLDFYTTSCYPDMQTENFTHQQIQKAITYCSTFLAKCHANKLQEENNPGAKDETFKNIQSYSVMLTHEQNGEDYNIEIPEEIRTNILTSVGFIKPKNTPKVRFHKYQTIH